MGALGPAPDVAIVGGGPAGCAAAIELARAGANVALIERERAPSAKVCGEFLSVEACAYARELGVDPLELGAIAIDRVRVAWRGYVASARLPFRGASVSRAAFDAALLTRAAAAGVRVLRGTRALAIANGALHVRDATGTHRIDADAIVLANGKFDIAGFERTATHDGMLGFKMHLACDDADETLDATVDLMLFDGGYAGMQPIEDGAYAFAIAISREGYARAGSWDALRAALARRPHLGQRLARARDRWSRPLAVANVPYGYRFRADSAAPHARVYRAGDQLAVIPSFTGDGIAIALVTGVAVARAIATGQSPGAFATAMQRRLDGPMRVAGAVAAAIRSAGGRAAVVLPASVAPAIFRTIATRTRIAR